MHLVNPDLLVQPQPRGANLRRLKTRVAVDDVDSKLLDGLQFQPAHARVIPAGQAGADAQLFQDDRLTCGSLLGPREMSRSNLRSRFELIAMLSQRCGHEKAD